MFPIPWTVAALTLVLYASAGMAIGALTGFLVSLALKLKVRGTLKDGLLGSFGFLLGFTGAVFMPWHQNAVSDYIGNTLVTSTTNTYQHPGRSAFVVAILLPLLRGVFRFKRERSVTRIG